MNLSHITQSAISAFVAALLVLAFGLMSFFMFEPQVSRATDSDPFIITQVIDGAVSFKTQPGNVSMNGGAGIDGLAGGYATGTTYAVVRANSGYYLDISFDNEGPSMIGNTTGNTGLRDYSSSTYRMIEPAFGFTASTAAMFGFTVTASSSASAYVDASFKSSGSNCNQPAGTALGSCYMAPDTTDFRIMDSNTAFPDGATTSIRFKIVVPNSPVPSLEADTYTATATLTAAAQ